MMSDLSPLLLLKYGIPCHKSSKKLHLQNNIGHKLVRGAGGGVCTCHSVQTVNAYVLFFVAFNVKSPV